MVDGQSGTITIIAGTVGSYGFSGDNGPATSAQLYQPVRPAVDLDGNRLFIGTQSPLLYAIYEFRSSNVKMILMVLMLAIDLHLFFTADSMNYRVRVVDLTTRYITTFAGTV